MKKKFAIVFLSLFLVVSLPFAAHANIVTATGKYLINAVKKIPGGAKVEATNTATGAEHVIKHGISSADLGKGIGAGIVGMAVGSGVGLAFQAITGLALDAVDLVMDPANNSIKWKKKGEGGGAGGGNLAPSGNFWHSGAKGGISSQSADALCAEVFAFFISINHPVVSGGSSPVIKGISSSSASCYFTNSVGNSTLLDNFSLRASPVSGGGAGSGVDSNGYKSVPLVDLAKKVIEQADGGQVDSQKTIEDYVTNLAKDGKLDTELDNAPDITQPENPEEPNPEEPKECPSGSVKVDDVCVKIPDSDSDEPLFCDSSEFTKKVCDWIDWTQQEHDEPESDAGKVDIIDKAEDLSIDNDRIDFSNQCPAPTPINTSVGGFPVSTELNYQPLCDFFTMLNPFVIGMGGISSALIIAGGARRG